MDTQVVDVVVRCKNEMPFVVSALEGLLRQEGVQPRILFLDDGSTDGSREAAESLGVRVVDPEPGRYIPGAVLNRGMRLTSSELVAFVNADAIPQRETALVELLAPFDLDARIAATFGRQIARPGADPLVTAEYKRAFGATEPVQVRRGRFFSMAASAVRRSAWLAMPFDEAIPYSEDVEWTTRLLKAGLEVRYVPTAEFEHSHDYDLRGLIKRRKGEGAADNRIHELGPPSIVSDLARPLAGSIARDLKDGLLTPRGVAVRVAQASGYYAGRRQGG